MSGFAGPVFDRIRIFAFLGDCFISHICCRIAQTTTATRDLGPAILVDPFARGQYVVGDGVSGL